jgi:O-antigen/teichoic acid export membrane protein
VFIAPVVAVGSLLFALAGMANTGLAVARKTRYLALAAAAGLVVNVAANLVLIPWLGVRGAAIATPIGNLAYLLVTYSWSRRYATWHIPWATLIRAGIAAGVAAAAAALVGVAATQPFANVVIDAAIGLSVYVGVLAALGEHRRGEAT